MLTSLYSTYLMGLAVFIPLINNLYAFLHIIAKTEGMISHIPTIELPKI